MSGLFKKLYEGSTAAYNNDKRCLRLLGSKVGKRQMKTYSCTNQQMLWTSSSKLLIVDPNRPRHNIITAIRSPSKYCILQLPVNATWPEEESFSTFKHLFDEPSVHDVSYLTMVCSAEASRRQPPVKWVMHDLAPVMWAMSLLRSECDHRLGQGTLGEPSLTLLAREQQDHRAILWLVASYLLHQTKDASLSQRWEVTSMENLLFFWKMY